MSIKHILVCRAGPADRPGWSRSDLMTDGRWHTQAADGTSLSNLIGGVIKLVGNGSSPPDVTVSSFRRTADLVRLGKPENFGIAAASRKTSLWSPLGLQGETGVWGEATFVRRDQAPLGGQRFMSQTVSDRLKDHLSDLAARDNGKLQEELWIRYGWTIEQVAPGLFSVEKWKIRKAEDSDEEPEEPEAAAGVPPMAGEMPRPGEKAKAKKAKSKSAA